MSPRPNDDKAPQGFCDKKLISWALHGNGVLQVLLVLAVVIVVFARVVPLEMQKRIVNESIALRKFDNLFTYCTVYLAAIVSASGLKFAINGLQTIIGERAMSAMRRALYDHIITLPLDFFRKTQPGFVVSSIISELSTIGTFSGMAVAVPLTNILTLIAFSAYLLWLNVKLALATMAIYPIVIFILPILQKKANMANKERVDLTRRTSSVIAESISGITEIHAHGAYNEEKRKFASLIGKLKKTRTRWTLLRHGTKTTNNFFVSLGPFIVFILGGYLTIKGQLQLGALVAFLSAQEKLYDPWKELIDFYQLYQDAHIRYQKTTEHFDVEPEISLLPYDKSIPPLEGALAVADLSFQADNGQLLLKDISFALAKGEHLALVGFSGSGKSTLAKCIGNLHGYTAGSIRLDNHELSGLDKSYIISNIGYVPQHPFIFTGTVEENLLYAHNAKYSDEGRPDLSLDDKIEALQNAALFVDVLRFGLETVLQAGKHELKEKVLQMRHNFHRNRIQDFTELIDYYKAPGDRLPGGGDQSALVEDGYLEGQPIINNIFFGRIVSNSIEDQERINQMVVQLLIEEDCLETVAQLGLKYEVGSGGMKLSGGQRQKLAIARVILKRPNFIILDEATSALDNASQTRIERLRLSKWQGRITVIAVVHRLDIIHSYDKIALMKNGRIVEFGSYRELMEGDGLLKQLVAEKTQ